MSSEPETQEPEVASVSEVHHVSADFDGRGFTTGDAEPPADALTTALAAFVAAVQDAQTASQQQINTLQGENAELRRRLDG